MNPDDSRLVSDWIHEYASHRVPAHLETVLRETETRRQRPAWSIPERWIPMTTFTAPMTTVRHSPWRIAALVAILVLALAAGAAVLIGSSGPARDPFTVKGELTKSRLGLTSTLAVAVGPSGLLYITDPSDHVTVTKADGSIVHRWGGTGSAPGTFRFTDPSHQHDPTGAIAVGPDGSVYVSDSANHRIQVFDQNYQFVRQFGSAGSGPGQFDVPFELAADPTGNVYVEDDGSERLTKFSPNGGVLWTVSGANDFRLSGHGHTPSFDPAGRVVVGDDDNGTVSYLDPATGAVVDSFQDPGACSSTVDGSGNVYVAHCDGTRVDVYGPDHTHLAGMTATPMYGPVFAPGGLGVARTPSGSIVILDVYPPTH